MCSSDLPLGKVTRALHRSEAEAGIAVGAPIEGTNSTGLVRFTVKGVYGVEAVVLEGPVDNIAELEASLDRIMRRVAGRSGPAESSVEHP